MYKTDGVSLVRNYTNYKSDSFTNSKSITDSDFYIAIYSANLLNNTFIVMKYRRKNYIYAETIFRAAGRDII